MARRKASIEHIPKDQMSAAIQTQLTRYADQRRPFERRWYDNNFFDDGFHFRYVSRKTGKIIDTSSIEYRAAPKRAIPKASRQIRGVASLLLQLDPFPVVYPRRINPGMFPPIQVPDPQTGQVVEQVSPELEAALDRAKEDARRIGWWIEDEWDEQEIEDKLVHMVILAAKHGVSFMQYWRDSVTGLMDSRVYDAFDVYLDGTLTSIYDSPSIIKTTPRQIAAIKSNELYDEDARMSISPDNRYASSEVKQAYMSSRFGTGSETEQQSTLIEQEAFTKEYISDDNKREIPDEVLSGKNPGDIVLRHTFATTNGVLLDEYLDYSEYPMVDFRFEPGPIYQVPLIERFIPANKSLDIAMSRVEGYSNTMVVGIYQKRKGENFKVSNIPGGQVLEYEATPLQQMQPSSVPAFIFQFIQILEKIIEEQGASTSTLGKLPEGIRSGVAIESLKATEYANLIIPTKMFRQSVKRIAQGLIRLGADSITDPREVARDAGSDTNFFDVIGEAGVEIMKEAQLTPDEDMTVIRRDTKVRIEIETGLGYTVEGKKATMQQVANYMLQLAEGGYIAKSQVQVVIKRFLDIFQFGSTAEFMDAMDEGSVDLTDQQIEQMKIAVLEVLRDAGVVGEEADQRGIDSTKVGIMEAIKDMESQKNKSDPLGLFT